MDINIAQSQTPFTEPHMEDMFSSFAALSANRPSAALAPDRLMIPQPTPGGAARPWPHAPGSPASSHAAAVAPPSAPAAHQKRKPSLFIDRSAQKQRDARREIQGLDPEALRIRIAACAATLSDPQACGRLRDHGAAVRARHALLTARLAELAHLASPTSARLDSLPSTPVSPDPPGDQPGSSWTGGMARLKRRLMAEQLDSPIAMPLEESLERQAQIYREHKERDMLQSLERMIIDEGQKGQTQNTAMDLDLDVDGMDDDDDDDDDGQASYGPPPDEARAWEMAYAAGFPRP